MKRTHPFALLRWSAVTALALVLACSARAANLTQYWPFEEASGSTTAANAVAGGNTATLVNFDPSVAWVADAPAKLTYSTKAISFLETDAYVNLKNIHLKNSATVSLWINPTTYDPGDVRLFSQVQFVSSHGGVVRFDPLVTGNVQASPGGPWVDVASLEQIPPGVWTHLAFVYDEGNLRLWINGVRQPLSQVVGFAFDQADFGLGARFDLGGAVGGPYGNAYNGLIDDVSIWNGPLSTDSIANLANGTRPTAITDVPEAPTAAKLVQYWPFEGSDPSTEAQNAVAGGNTGHLVNADPAMAWVKTDKPAQLAYSTTSVAWDGTDDYVNVGNVGLKNEGTISMWIKPTTAALEQLWMRPYSLVSFPASVAGVTAMGLLPSGVAFKGAVLVWSGSGWQVIGAGGSVQADRWTHFAVAHSPGRATLYLDGEPQLTVQSGLDFDQAELGLGAPFDVEGTGGGPYGIPYGGLMDDVSIWDKALQPSSIRKLASGVQPSSVTDSPATEPPTIFTQPVGATVVLGEPATLSVVAKGAGTLTYQWQRGNTPIAGASSNIFTLPAVALTNAGDYQVVVANPFGSATSRVAKLTVDPGVPAITTQPQSLVKRTGTPAFGFKNLDPATKYEVYVYGVAIDFGLGGTERFSLVGGDSQPVMEVPNTGWPVLNRTQQNCLKSSQGRPNPIPLRIDESLSETLSETLSTKTCDKVSDKGKNPAGIGVARLAPPKEVFY